MEAAKKSLSKAGFSGYSIHKALVDSGNHIGQSPMYEILNSIGKRCRVKLVGLSTPLKVQPRTTRKLKVIRNVDKLTSKKSPPGQITISAQL